MTARILGTAVAAAALLIGSAVAASPVSAQDNVRGSVFFPAEWAPVAQCGGGEVIGLAFEVDFTRHEMYGSDGEVLRERLTMVYKGWLEDLSSGERSGPVMGTRNILFDYVADRYTNSGNMRSMTLPGVGKVFQYSGHEVWELEADELIVKHGPTVDELSPGGAVTVCQAMGLSGGIPMEPPNVHD